VDEVVDDSPIGRLLDELSWEGNARKYRNGGRGLENVLVTQVFQALDLLPRTTFLAEVLRQAHGDPAALAAVAQQAESALVDVLPGTLDPTHGAPAVQPDAVLRMSAATVLVEAKRLRSGSFQPEQLAREYLVLERSFSSPTRILLLVLPDPPPVAVRGRGRLPIHDAILEQLEVVHARAQDPPPLGDLVSAVDRRCAWTTWTDIDRILLDGVAALPALPAAASARRPSRRAGVSRDLRAVVALVWESERRKAPGRCPGPRWLVLVQIT